jgi:hypothetical protein
MTTAYDYSAGRIAPAALIAAGVRTVMRYVSTPGNGKNITASEYAELTAAGITVGLVYETTASWMLGGYSAGHAAAVAARAQATAVGYPATHRIWYADDLDDTTADIATVLDCLHGCADAEGSKSLVALYGEYDAVEAAAGAGFAAPWQTEAWSAGRQSSSAVLLQIVAPTTCDGVQVDVNEVLGPLFPPAPTVPPAPHPAATAATPQEDEMSTTSVNGRAGLSWPAGTRHVAQVTYDPAPGDPVLRVVWALTTGPLVATLAPVHGTGTVELAPEHVAACRGVVLEHAGGPQVVFDACAV